MERHSALLALLEAEVEPTQKHYNDTVDDVFRTPQHISGLMEESVRDDVLILMTTQHHRLTQFFCRVRPHVRQMSMSAVASNIAVETVALLIRMLPDLHQLLDPTSVLKFLLPALDVCFGSLQRPALQELASVLTEAGSLLEYISSDRLGSEIIRQWVCTTSPLALDNPTLEVWTQRLVKMLGSCRKSHDIASAAQQWSALKTVKASLKDLHSTNMSLSKNQPGSVARQDLLPPGKMVKLTKDDKKARVAKRQNSTTSLVPVTDHLRSLLNTFELPTPGSTGQLHEAIKHLERDKTTAILLSIAANLPCNLCILELESSSEISSPETDERSIEAMLNLEIKVLDEGVGIWKVLLSPQALRSLLHLESHGLACPATEKLKELASGFWKPPHRTAAATESQMKGLRVPLGITQFGERHSILWQIDIGLDKGMEALQQMIIVWEVCEKNEIPKIIDRVIFIQRSYSDETVRRCLQHSSTHDGRQIPTHFDTATSDRLLADHDTRMVDQEIIDMTNKFYALTEPVMRSILSSDILAEFPFDISKEEAQIIGHFQTASLILGRSGTGKTTCLVYKLVRKYLATKAVAGEKPIRQILLTRSSFLAEKLRSYARNLIETLSCRSASSELSEHKEASFMITGGEDSDKDSVLTLRDESFPKVYTWDHFLQVLENTTRIWHREGFAELVGQVVDFYSFKVNYWPRFSHSDSKGLSANLVFAEIMGVIKGSASSADSLMPLVRKDYLTRSCRMAPTFAMEVERSRVYDIFESYENMKVRRGDMDYIDRVVRILRALRQDPSLRKQLRSKFEEVYIDEIQDQRCLDIELLLSFVKDPRGFHFAGDTAQAISQDATFKFSDIKGMIFQHFSTASISTRQPGLARPQLFTLSKNYRSHQGILSLASLVMGMIWQGFPETVDKLEPEIGNRNGPKPVLFIGVDFSLIISNNVGHATLSAGTADFGAEQAILVRDTAAKSALQAHIGEVVLIFTILESKGMEFDDIILWNFFTECPDQAGVRSLEVLKNDPAKFDPKKHGLMCSELKNLYVAVTRARNQLFMVESSETTAATILQLLPCSGSEAIIDVTRPEHDDFTTRVELLRPGSSVDLKGWRQRGEQCMRQQMYTSARMCFGKAEYAEGANLAEGFLQKEAAENCSRTEDHIRCLRTALEHFLKAELIEEATGILVKLGNLEEAAELWTRDQNHRKAADLFAKAGLHMKALDSYHRAKEYGEAAALLRNQKNFDELVLYLDTNRELIPAAILKSHSLLCKLLLKQHKISPGFRDHAIRLLGTPTEQEACFVQYGMIEHLASFYNEQQRYKDLFHLYCKTGQLQQALEVAISNDLLKCTENDLETDVVRLLDYVWTGHMQATRRQQSMASFKLPTGHLSPIAQVRAEQWLACNNACISESSILRQYVADWSDTVPKILLCVREILNFTAIAGSKNLDELPFEMTQKTISFARDLILNKDSGVRDTLFLLAGLWKHAKGNEDLIVLPWSPLRDILTGNEKNDFALVVQKVLDRLGAAILALDTKARDLWKEKWPRRCATFTTLGFCPKKRNGEECLSLHELIDTNDCAKLLDDLLMMNSIFCALAVFYYRRCMNEEFQQKYLGIKRYWLERLLRELTYLSSVEQHSAGIRKTREELSYNKKVVATASFLEELLYFRLGNEWERRSNFTSLLEQMQLAKAFSSKVQNRIFRALSHRLLVDRRGLLQRHLSLLGWLEENVGFDNASLFKNNLTTFLLNLDKIEAPGLSTLHSLTAIFEYLAAHLVLKTCAAACILPKSWIDLHVMSTNKFTHMPDLIQDDNKHRYQGCLIQLGFSFCHLLSRLDKATLPADFLLCSGRAHPPLPLRQRNAELVAILVANLVSMSAEPPTGFNELWARVKEVFEHDFVKAIHLRSRTPHDLIQRLVPSLARYNGKDALVVVIRDRKRRSAFSDLEHQPGVMTIPFEQLCPPAEISAAADASADQNVQSTTADDAAHDQYSAAETEAMIKIQRLWRSVSIKIQKRRSYVSKPECEIIVRYFNMAAQCPVITTRRDQKSFRRVLVTQGVPLCVRLTAARRSLAKLQEDAMTCVDNVEISQGVYESVDVVLARNGEVKSLLCKVEEKMSDEFLMGLVERGVLSVLEEMMKDVEETVREVENVLLEIRKMIVAISGS